jgi:hypothetical protein
LLANFEMSLRGYILGGEVGDVENTGDGC